MPPPCRFLTAPGLSRSRESVSGIVDKGSSYVMPGGGQVERDGIYLNHGFLLCLVVIKQEACELQWRHYSKMARDKALHAEKNIKSIENGRRCSEGGRCLDRHSPSERKQPHNLSQATPPKVTLVCTASSRVVRSFPARKPEMFLHSSKNSICQMWEVAMMSSRWTWNRRFHSSVECDIGNVSSEILWQKFASLSVLKITS